MKNFVHLISTRVLTALIFVAFAVSMIAQEVNIPDPGLNAAIRQALNKPVGPLTAQDMLGLTNLDARSRSISSVEGLQAARNLSSLFLDFNSLTNLDLPNTLTNLDLLTLGLNPLTRCSIPSGLTKLRILAMDDCLLTNFTLPANLTGLTTLDVFHNQLTDFILPGGYSNLTVLDLGFNSLVQCSIPAGLTNPFPGWSEGGTAVPLSDRGVKCKAHNPMNHQDQEQSNRSKNRTPILIVIPPVRRACVANGAVPCPFFQLAKALKRKFLATLAFTGVLLALDSASAQFVLAPVPGLPSVASGSVAWDDYDNDGRLDFLLTGTDGSTGLSTLLLWRNTGSGFINVPIPGLTGVYFGSIASADFDNDGRLDFLVTGITNSSLPDAMITQLWRNTGDGFTNVPVPGLAGVYVSSVAWGDFDYDGLLDFLLEGLSGSRTALNFDILASTNVTLPPTNWTNLGSAASLGGGLYRFTDAGATGQPQRFYLLREQ